MRCIEAVQYVASYPSSSRRSFMDPHVQAGLPSYDDGSIDRLLRVPPHSSSGVVEETVHIGVV
jgi:hypothetical protein